MAHSRAFLDLPRSVSGEEAWADRAVLPRAARGPARGRAAGHLAPCGTGASELRRGDHPQLQPAGEQARLAFGALAFRGELVLDRLQMRVDFGILLPE